MSYPIRPVRVDNLEAEYFGSSATSAYMPRQTSSSSYVSGHTAATYGPAALPNIQLPPPPFPEFLSHDWSTPQAPPAEQKRNPVVAEQPLLESISGPDPLFDKLSSENYKSKFKRLVEVEKTAHEGKLRERYISKTVYFYLLSITLK